MQPLPPHLAHFVRTGKPGVHGIRRAVPPSFLGSREGKRVLILAIGMVAVMGSLLFPSATRSRILQSDPAQPQPPIAVVHLPASFVGPETLHRLRTTRDGERLRSTQDYAHEDSLLAGISALFDDFDRPPTESAPPVAIELHADEAVAEPEKFRGGLVRYEGVIRESKVLPLDDGVPASRVFHRVLLVRTPRSAEDGIFVATREAPPAFHEGSTRAVVEGVFLGTTTFETNSGDPPTRTVPYLVARSIRLSDAGRVETLWRNQLFIPMIAILIVGILVTSTIIYRQVKRRREVPSFLRVRAPGPRR